MAQIHNSISALSIYYIKAADHSSTIIMAVTNSDAFAKVKAVGSGDVLAGNHVLEVYK